MKKLRLIASVLLALPLIIFEFNFFLEFISAPPDASVGSQMLDIMRDNGMMVYMALSHILVGLLLLYPKTNYVAALLQLPISIGIVIFHLTLMPAGIGIGVILLVLNVVTLWDMERLSYLLR